jgi:hypothetical protein
MLARPLGLVARVADWQYAGVSYHVLVGKMARVAGYVTLLAFGPEAAYRAVVVGPDGADRALRGLMTAPDLATRSGTAECLLALRAVLVN